MHPGERREPAWQAQVPPGALPPARRPRGRGGPYRGPPAYPAPPRWGFPRLAWRWPTAIPGDAELGRTVQPGTLRDSGRLARRCLAATAAVLVLGATGEVWRYVLLVVSLHGRVAPGMLAASEALAETCGVLGIVLGTASLLLVARWLFPARRYAAAALRRVPGRAAWQVVLGSVLPVVNLTVPFSVLAELEHDVLGRGPRERVRPSRLLLCWLGAWDLGAVLCAVTLAFSFRGGLTAAAHGMLWAAATALVAATVAALSEVLVRRATVLLLPPERGSLRRSQLLGLVEGSPQPGEPSRRPRPVAAPR